MSLVVYLMVFLIPALISVKSNEISDDDRFRWYSIVSKVKYCDCELAIEIPTTRANCPMTRLIACPYDNISVYQHWRWDGVMLKSRLNGLVWDLDNSKPRHIVLGHATNNTDQQFRYNKDIGHIYPNSARYNNKKVVDLSGANKNLLEAELIIFNKKGIPARNQVFQFRPVQL
ncbi:hypothetical protein CHUAL_008615 [Chamberlinius hualienensis]